MAMSTADAGRKGALSLNKKLTPKERSESARRASLARWAKHKKGKTKKTK